MGLGKDKEHPDKTKYELYEMKWDAKWSALTNKWKP